MLEKDLEEKRLSTEGSGSTVAAGANSSGNGKHHPYLSTPDPVDDEDRGAERHSSNLPREFRALFTKAPLGLTLTAQGSSTGMAWVSNTVPEGQAEQLGVQIGDFVVGIGNDWMGSYDEVMRSLPSQAYPFALVFRRNNFESPRNSLQSVHGLGLGT